MDYHSHTICKPGENVHQRNVAKSKHIQLKIKVKVTKSRNSTAITMQ